MFVHPQPEALEQIVLDPRVDPARAAHQFRLALAPFRVEALDDDGQARSLVAPVVPPRRQEAAVGT